MASKKFVTAQQVQNILADIAEFLAVIANVGCSC